MSSKDHLQLLYIITVFHGASLLLLCLACGPSGLVLAHSLGLVVASLEADVGELLVDGYPVIVKTRRLQDDSRRADHHRHREDPEKQPVQDHRNILPILLGLKKR